MVNMNDVLAVILGGGRGTRLHPLTAERSKPAVPIAGKYRLIDIPISNCIHSGVFKIAVLTQFNSVSLHRHIAQTYDFDHFHTGWVQILAAEQTPTSESWYQGTADAVRKQIQEIKSASCHWVLVLAGDHLYRMDYAAFAARHIESGAQISVAVQPIPRHDAARFGVLKRNEEGRITSFAEKPKDPVVLQEMVSRDDPERPYLGSLGIYLFDMNVLLQVLENPAWSDFGSDIIPRSLSTHRVMAYEFSDYWEDIGTIRSFYDTMLGLTGPNPVFNFYDPQRPIYTHARFLPGSSVEDSHLERVLLCEGSRISKAEVCDSMIGVRSLIGEGARVRSCIIMGSDAFDLPGEAKVPIGIGPGADIQGAILDKNARIGAKVVIRPWPRGTPDIDTRSYVVRDGVVVVPKGALIPPGTRIGPD